MSILRTVWRTILLVAVGVATARCHGDVSAMGASADMEKPIELPEARRICASLCMAGLGGIPCGELCTDIQPEISSRPQSLPSVGEHYPSYAGIGGCDRRDAVPEPRWDACPLLCAYQLGDPLCKCSKPNHIDSYKVDFKRICAYFCLVHKYNIYGCRPCKHFERPPYLLMAATRKRDRPPPDDTEEWQEWCKYMCSINEGGSACNCYYPNPLMEMPRNDQKQAPNNTYIEENSN